jgi:repressor LexA
MMGLTERQAACLTFIVSYTGEFGTAPSFNEMRDHLGLSSRGRIHEVVMALEERGAIRRLPNRARAIEVLPTRNVIRSFSDAALLAEVERRAL